MDINTADRTRIGPIGSLQESWCRLRRRHLLRVILAFCAFFLGKLAFSVWTRLVATPVLADNRGYVVPRHFAKHAQIVTTTQIVSAVDAETFFFFWQLSLPCTLCSKSTRYG